MKAIFPIIIVVIVVLAGWYLVMRTPANPSATSTTTETGTASTTSTVPTIAYTDSGFSPTSITVPVGTTVTFVDQASDQMWVASGMHPTHEGYDGTSRAVHCAAGYTGPAPFDECAAIGPGGSWTFTFSKAGTWPFHNHLSPTEFGKVIVQ